MSLREFTYRIVTLGCKVNQAEAAELEAKLNRQGWSATRDEPEVYLVNTCAVTRVSEAKSRRLIKRIIRENPASRVIVTGCYATSNPLEIKQNIRNGIDTLIPQKEKERIPVTLHGKSAKLLIENNRMSKRTRAFLKIQDGCANFCSYCIVPLLRGKPTSKPVHEIMDEAKNLVKQGYKEIVLVGINMGQYDYLIRLLKESVQIDDLARIRLSSIEVKDIGVDLLSLMKTNPKICPHLHIPLQSGSNRILKLMNRRYNREEYLERINKIKHMLNNPGITTDIIVGFPGESDKDFQETMDTARKAGFSKIHIFPYSSRPGTKAESLPERVPVNIVKERCRQLDKLQRKLALSYKEQFINKEVTILLEGKGNTGYTKEYLKVTLNKTYPDKINQIIRARVNRVTAEYLEALTI